MKKLLLLFFSTLILNAQGQISITQNEMPHAGDDLYRTRANVNPFLNYGATGANHVWNFTNLVANVQDSALYQTVASTNFVYALVYADIFFNPNRANVALEGVDIPFNNLLPITNPYTFFYRSSSVYKKVGYGAELAGIPVPIIYTDQDEIYSLPLNFGDNDSTFSSYNLSIPTLAYYGYEQSRLNDVDGWGVINTPSGTFDVLRVKTELLGKDTVQIDTLNFGFAIQRPVVTEYKWLAQNIRVPILQINTTTLFGIELITDIWFYDAPRSVTVVQPLASVLCPGDAVQVNYDATGAFNPGALFNPANIFRAQLSDASGSFANPVNIGSVTSTQSGIINGIIPANTPAGTGYRIRVISTNPAFTGDDNGFDITIGEAPLANITASSPLEFCIGGSVVLSADTNSAYTYQWQLDGVDIAGADASDYMASVGGDYTVVVTNSCGNSTSNIMNVIVNDLPEHTFSQNSIIACSGNSATITSINNSGQSSLSYQWYLDGMLLPGETNSDITTSDAGNYTLEITNSLTGCMFTTSQVSLLVDSIASPLVTASSSTSLCEGDSVELTVNAVTGLNYQWIVDGIVIPNATGTSYYASFPGVYTVDATSVNGCLASTVTGVSVLVFPLPLTPVLNLSGASTFCAGDSVTISFNPEAGVTYQWQLDGIDIAGATASSHTSSVSGAYSVISTGANGCNALAVPSITITVEPIPAAPVLNASGATTFCQGDSVLLDFTTVANINYQWQLDGIDISGATSSSYTATVAGIYTVSAVSAAGCSSLSTGVTIIINALPPDPTITSNGNNVFCDGGSVTLETPLVAGYIYQWSLNNVDISGATLNEYVVSINSGSYSVSVTDGNGCSTPSSASIQVTVNPLPTAPVLNTSGATTFCQGDSVLLDFTPDPNINYQWQLDGIDIAGATSPSYTATVAGIYTVSAVSAASCSSLSAGVTVIINALPPDPTITSNGNNIFCDGGSVTLETPLVAGYIYQWSLNSVDISGATLNEYVVSASSGTYSVSVTDGNGCSTPASASIQVTINPLPAAPVITQSYDTLFASGGGAYQWFLNGNAISGATGSYYIVLTNGNYTVTVTDTNTCENVSVVYPFNSVGINEAGISNISVYPNPSSGIFIVEYTGIVNNSYTYELTDLRGRTLVSGSSHLNKLVIDLSGYSDGVYLIKIQNAKASSVFKLIKQ